jgi:acyl-CoA hydrolase
MKASELSCVVATHMVMPTDTNALGNAFGGTIMSWMDIAAATTAMRHSNKPCVTASIDDIQFKKPILLGEIVTLKSRVNYTGRTSMEVGIEVFSENPLTGKNEHCLTGYMTFVAITELGLPAEIPQLELKTEEDKRLWAEALERVAQRKARRK